MFSIKEVPFGQATAHQIHNTTTGEWVEVLGSLGARINQVVLQHEETLHTLLEDNGPAVDYTERARPWYRGVCLFPYPDRVRKGRYTFEGKVLQLAQHNFPHALHGFVHDQAFTVTETTADANGGSLRSHYAYDGREPGYPFPCQLTITHDLDPTGYQCTTEVVNTGPVTMPVGQGWHPYFHLGGEANSWQMKVGAEQFFEVDGAYLPTGHTHRDPTFREFRPLEAPGFLACFYQAGKERSEARLRHQGDAREIVVWQQGGEKGYGYTQYFMSPAASLAIEPLTCPPDAFNSGKGLIKLAPEEQLSLRWGIRIEQGRF